jgi:hypothetical protein
MSLQKLIVCNPLARSCENNCNGNAGVVIQLRLVVTLIPATE